MKSGDAVFLHLAATVAEPAHDLTLVFYDCEEIDSAANGLGRIERELPDWLSADVAILGEPTAGYIEAGCQGTLRVVISATGTRAHSARSWLGDNAIHKLGAVLDRLAGYRARTVDIDGCAYREGLSAVRIDGGVAGNVIPDAASVTVNFRFAPDRSPDAALHHVHEVFDGLDVRIEQTDSAAGALPGLSQPAAKALVEAAGGQVRAKYGWTDVSRFAALGIPAVNFGPGDPNLAHTRDERVPVAEITAGRDDAAALPGRLSELFGLGGGVGGRRAQSRSPQDRRDTVRSAVPSPAVNACACASAIRPATQSISPHSRVSGSTARMSPSRTASCQTRSATPCWPPRSAIRAASRAAATAPCESRTEASRHARATPSSGPNSADLVPCRDSALLSAFAAAAMSPCWASAVASSISDSGPHE